MESPPLVDIEITEPDGVLGSQSQIGWIAYRDDEQAAIVLLFVDPDEMESSWEGLQVVEAVAILQNSDKYDRELVDAAQEFLSFHDEEMRGDHA